MFLENKSKNIHMFFRKTISKYFLKNLSFVTYYKCTISIIPIPIYYCQLYLFKICQIKQRNPIHKNTTDISLFYFLKNTEYISIYVKSFISIHQ